MEPIRKMTGRNKMTAILQVMREHGTVTSDELKRLMKERFGNSANHIYYYLGILRKDGYIRIEKRGRCRFYTLV